LNGVTSCWRPRAASARAVQLSIQSEDAPPLVELTLAVPRYPYRTFAERLRQYRRERGWRQVDLAKAIGVNKDTVWNWETGRTEPRLEILRAKGVQVIYTLQAEAARRPLEPLKGTLGQIPQLIRLVETME